MGGKTKSAAMRQRYTEDNVRKLAKDIGVKAALEEWRIITAAFLIVLSDKYGMNQEQLQDIYNRVNDYGEKIHLKQIKKSDLFDALKRDYDIVIAKET